MSNSTKADPGLWVDALTESFFSWVQNDILPVCTAILDLLVIIVGLVLNILLLVTFKKRALFNDPSTYFVTMLIVADFVSYFFLLIPNIISAIATDWILSQPVCEIHGSFIFLLVFVNLGFAGVLSIERAIKLVREDPELYDCFFETKKYRVGIMTGVWVLAVILAFIPTTGAGDVRYDFYHQGCMLDYGQTPAFLIVHFLLTIVLSSVIVVVSYSLIFNKRRKSVLSDRLRRFQATNQGGHDKRLPSNTNTLPTISESDGDENTNNQAFENIPAKPPKKPVNNLNERRRSSKPRQSLIFEVLCDDVKKPDFHLSITYIALWGTIMACSLPFFIVCFYGTFNDNPLWGGCYNITLLVMHVCFVAKPFVYLGHNRHLRRVTTQTVPQAVRNRANSVRSSIHHMSESVQDLLFKQNAQRKLQRTLAVHKAISMWKKKSTKGTGVMKLKEVTEPDSGVKPIGKGVKSDLGSANPATHSEEKDTINLPTSPSRPNSLDNRLTPSGVIIGTAPSPTPGQSSYIERERQRLLGMDKRDHGTVSVGGGWRQSDQNNTSPMPGMIRQDLDII